MTREEAERRIKAVWPEAVVRCAAYGVLCVWVRVWKHKGDLHMGFTPEVAIDVAAADGACDSEGLVPVALHMAIAAVEASKREPVGLREGEKPRD